MVKSGRRQELANLLYDVRWTLRRFEISGRLAVKTDFELLLAGCDHAEFQGIRLVFEELLRHWSEISRNKQSLAYYIGGRLTTEERKNKYTALYSESMVRYLSCSFLVPRLKFWDLRTIERYLKCRVL